MSNSNIYPAFQTSDQGLITFVGDYVNKEVPLWLSVFGPVDGPGNVQVSSMTVNGAGFVELQASTIQTVPFPATEYAPVVFDRGVTDITTYNTSLKMNVSNNVQGITPDEPFLSVTKQNGISYDDLAVNGLQIFGNQLTDDTVNAGAVAYLTGTGNAVTLRTNAGGNFNTSTINVGTLNANLASISTLNVSSLSANSITATTFISSSTAVSQNLATATANISTANISTANISTARISSITTRVAVIQDDLLSADFYLSVDGVPANSQFKLAQRSGVPSGGVDMIAAPASGGKIRMFTGSPNVNSIPGSSLALQIDESGTVTMPRNLIVSTINTNQISTALINASTINTNVISTGSIRTSAISISTINFRPSISPSVDLGLGGAIGGALGGAAANGFNTLLGTAALGTGIAGLTLPRTSGGLNPGNFQTIAGTSQIQFSTLGAPNTLSQSTPTAFLTTTNGVGVFGSTISTFTTLRAGTWAFRTASDPLNLATNPSTIGATSTIQAVGQWNKVFPGSVSMGVANNLITTLDCQNVIDMGGSAPSALVINTNFPTPSGDFPASDPRIILNPITEVVIGNYSGTGPVPGSQLRVSTIVGVSSINGAVYPPPDQTVPIGSMLMWPVGNYANIVVTPPAGYLLCDGSLQSSATYPALSAVLQNFWNPTWPAPNPSGQFYLPATQGRMPIGGITNSYNVSAIYQGTFNITRPDGSTTTGAQFSGMQLANSNGTVLVGGGACVIYRGMYASSPSATGRIINILNTNGSWNSPNLYLVFATPFVTASPVGTTFIFTNAQTNPGDFSKEYPVVGWTNPDGTVQTGSHPGYGQPYRFQNPSEIAPHTHSGSAGAGNVNALNTSNNPIGGQNTGNNNFAFNISGVGQVAESYYQNPPNFGVNYIIKAL